MVPKVVFGSGCFDQLSNIIEVKRKEDAPFIYLVDDVFKGKESLTKRIPLKFNDKLIFVSTLEEPKTLDVDTIVEQLKKNFEKIPSGIIGIGGGSVMDLAKAVSLLLKNPGSASDYQGWDLVENKAVYHVGIPTISGTGA
ncbi:MAG: iron-containing alcohol dehydrogenase, partial [Flavobacteriaceae bacterium]